VRLAVKRPDMIVYLDGKPQGGASDNVVSFKRPA
jgi:hypothetical protein